MNITKLAIAALIVAGSASASLATEFDGNLANRYPGFATQAPRVMQSAPVRMQATPVQQNNWVPAPAHAGGVG